MASIENVPKWAQFRCSGRLTDAEHRNHAHLGSYPMLAGEEVVDRHQASKTCPNGHGFDVRDGRQRPSIETCPDGHFFDARRVGRWWTDAEHRKRAQMGMVSMLGG